MQGYKNIFQFLSLFLFTQQICDVTSNVIQIQLHPIREDRNYHVPYQQGKDVSYTAAVVEFAPVESLTDPPSLILSTNMAEYQNFVHQAKNQGADIIVFPEYGLTSTYPSDNRSLAREYGQIIPSPDEFLNPCNTYNSSMEYETLRRLSCYAKDSSIYLVANIIEKFPCEGCADDNVLLYNTNVAFDRYGNVITRYRKFNLFAEFALNQTTLPEHSTFVADFGAKFGLITCFDIMFESPAVTLVTEYHVTDIIFPSAWIQELPFLTGVQTQMMWSYAMNVNFLGSGYNNAKSGKGGSGIYNGKSGVITDITPWDRTSTYLIGQIPKIRNEVIESRNKRSLNKVTPYYYQEDLTNYTTRYIALTNEIMTHNICDNGLCCEIHISGRIYDATVLRLIIFNGERSFGNGYYTNFKIQTCGVIRCKNSDDPVKNCALLLSDEAVNITINSLKIKGNFNKDAIIGPNIVDGKFKILTGDYYNFNKISGELLDDISLELLQPITENVLTFALWGRVYPKKSK